MIDELEPFCGGGAALPDLLSQPGSPSRMSRGQEMWVTLVSPRPIPFGAIL